MSGRPGYQVGLYLAPRPGVAKALLPSTEQEAA
jgi:hypothetical protein